MFSLLRLLATSIALAGTALASVNPVVVQGQEFVDSVTKNRVMIIGVDYQPGGSSAFDPSSNSDVLSDGAACVRDAALLQMLGVNTIRVYNVDPNANHDECASIFYTAGIYMILDVNTPFVAINRDDPASTYDVDYLTHIFGVVEAFKDYPNTMAFFAGNELINDVNTSSIDPAYIRAVQRDLKGYISKHASRAIPVGYSAADVRTVLQDTWAYLQCDINGDGSDTSRSDFFGLNSYSWCGATATYQSSGYDKLVAMFNDSAIPVFFSEYGCNLPAGQARLFNEVQALYGPNMIALSGGLVYEYSEEPDKYGLVVISSNGTINILQDFINLQGQYDKLNIKLLENTAAASGSTNPPSCSANLISNSGFSSNFSIPPPPPGGSDLINNGISNPPSGKIITPASLSVTFPVYNVTGQLLTGLSVTSANGANTPGSSTGSAPGSGSTKKGDAGRVTATSSATAAILGIFVVLFAFGML